MINFDLDGSTSPLSVEVVGLRKLLGGPYTLTMLHVGAKNNFKLFPELCCNLFELKSSVFQSFVNLISIFDSQRILIHLWALLSDLHHKLVGSESHILGFCFLWIYCDC